MPQSNTEEKPEAAALITPPARGDEEFRLLVESVKDYAIFMLDPTGRIVSWNLGAERAKGYRAHEIIGKHFSTFYTPEAIARRHPERELEIAAAEGRFEEEGWRLRKDGSQFWANVVITALYDADGRLHGFGKVTRDITDRKRAEEERAQIQALTDAALARLSVRDLLGELMHRVSRILNVDTVGLLLLEGDTLVLRATQGLDEERALGFRLPIGIGFAGRIAATQAPVIVNDVTATDVVSPVLRAKGVRSLLGTPLMVEGRLVGVLHVGSLTRREFGEADTRLLQMVADRVALAIEQARLFEQVQEHAAELEQRVADRTLALQEANAELEAFSFTVSHDLLAPLRHLQGFADALLEDFGADLPPEGREYATRIIAASQRMDLLIRDLLEYSRLSRAELDLRPVSLEAVVRDVIRTLEHDIRARAAVVDVENPLPTVLAHRGILIQVVQNLLTNALKFTAHQVPPHVRVCHERNGPSVRLWVEDKGIGISAEHQARIFRVFERLHGGETYPGTGIGLAIVRRAVERMGGQVGLESELGAGSRFWIELPESTG